MGFLRGKILKQARVTEEKIMTTIKTFIQRHPVLSYYILTFAISWGGILLVIRANGGLPATQEEFARQVAWAIPAMLGGPSVAGILMTAIVSGKAGFRDLFARLRKWRVGIGWYGVALLTAPLLFWVVHATLSLASPVFLSGVVTTPAKAPFLLTNLVAALMVGFCEELGWTGFAIPRLRLRHGVLATGLIAGVLWGTWHAPVISVWPSVALSDGLSVPLFAAASFALVLVGQLPAFRVLMVWVYDRTGSLLVAMLMHASLTASTFILGPAVISGVALLVYDIVLGVAWWAVVAVVAMTSHWQISSPGKPSTGFDAPQLGPVDRP
jgi:membrane protease YdiL (CAAX protease family)